MNPYLSVAALVLISSVLFFVPLIPAIIELKREEDGVPLKVIQEHAGEIRYFADSFRNYIKPLKDKLQECLSSGGTATGTMPDGAEYLVLGRGEEALGLPLQQRGDVCSVVLVSGTDLVLPSETTFSRDIYAGGGFIGGDQNQYRAVLAEKDVQLGRGSQVMRWVHAVGEFRAEQGCNLYGRISSDTVIRLQAGCRFLRLNAPRIETGPLPPVTEWKPPTGRSAPPVRRRLQDGNFELSAGEEFAGDLVVRGNLRLNPGSRVWGSVKSGGDLIVENRVLVGGSLMSAKRLHIGAECLIYGPVIAERELEMKAGTKCGSPECPTTVSAPRITTEEGVVVFGTLWAREQGEVVRKS